MNNTGKNIVLTLKQINSQTFLPNGVVETNTPGTPEYIPPYNSTNCPVSYSLVCPLAVINGHSGSIGFEFSLYNSVVDNPNVSSINILAISQSITRASSSFNLPNITHNYFSGSILPLIHGSYTVSIQYLSGSSVLATCANTASISVI